MPKIRRWFHVSHDRNADPEVWELTETFGDRALRIHDAFLSIADRNDGCLPTADNQEFIKGVAYQCRMAPKTVEKVILWMVKKAWLEVSLPTGERLMSSWPMAGESLVNGWRMVGEPLVSDWPTFREWLKDHSPAVLSMRNHAKYRGSWGDSNKLTGETINFPPPLPHTPSPDLEIITTNVVIPQSQENLVTAAPSKWAPEDQWLKTFLDTQTLVAAPREAFDDPQWWGNVAEVVNGLNLPFLTQEFAKMGAWLIEKKSRTPIKPAGWKKFTRGWLERAADERRNGHGNQAKRW